MAGSDQGNPVVSINEIENVDVYILGCLGYSMTIAIASATAIARLRTWKDRNSVYSNISPTFQSPGLDAQDIGILNVSKQTRH